MIVANVVFPQPGGAHNTTEPRRPLSIAFRTVEPGARMCLWPWYSSSVRGRIRLASGKFATRSCGESKRSGTLTKFYLSDLMTHFLPAVSVATGSIWSATFLRFGFSMGPGGVQSAFGDVGSTFAKTPLTNLRLSEEP